MYVRRQAVMEAKPKFRTGRRSSQIA